MRKSFLSLVLCLGLGACVPAKNVLSPEGYQHAEYNLKVSALPDGQLLPPNWKLDNLVKRSRKGRVTNDKEADRTKTWFEDKKGEDYETTYRLDGDGDGEYETEADEPAYELKYVHTAHDGEIFLRAVPLSGDESQKRLKVLMARYVEAAAGAGYRVVPVGQNSSVLIERRYAASVTQEGDARLAGNDAYYAHLEIANMDQVKLDPNARRTHVELILRHTTFKYKKKHRGGTGEYPVLLIAGYANQPEEFEEGRADFLSFLKRLKVNGGSGLKLPTSASKAPVTSKAPTAPPEKPAAEATAAEPVASETKGEAAAAPATPQPKSGAAKP